MDKQKSFYSYFTASFESEITEKSKAPYISTHFHETYELYFLLKGTRTYFTNTDEYKLKQNYVTLTKPNALHGTKGTAYSRILIYFHADLLKKHLKESYVNELLSCFNETILPAKEVINHPEIKDLFTAVCTKVNNHEYEIAITYLITLLQTLSLIVKKMKKNEPVLNDNTDLIKDILAYMEENIEQIENISQIADHFYLSKFYFCHLFKKKTNFSVGEYVTYLRIKKAQELLKETDRTVDDIAYSIGFNDRSYFCYVFKKRVGIPPSKYRNIYKNDKTQLTQPSLPERKF